MDPKFKPLIIVIAVAGLCLIALYWGYDFLGSRTIVQTNQAKAKTIATALAKFAAGNQGRLPENLSDLLPPFLPNTRALQATYVEPPRQQPWIYLPKARNDSGTPAIILHSPRPWADGQRVVIFNDFSVRTISEAEFQTIISARKNGTVDAKSL
jgi:hypothetical protein